MSRSAVSGSLLTAVAVAAIVVSLTLSPAPGEAPRAAEAPQGKAANRARDLRAKLAAPITLDRGIDPNTPLKDLIEFLAEKQGVTIVLDHEAFAAAGIEQVEQQPMKLPKLVSVRFSSVLQLVLKQLKGSGTPPGALYLVRPDFIEITTLCQARTEIWGPEDPEATGEPATRPMLLRRPQVPPPNGTEATGEPATRPMLPLCHADFDKQPLSEALRDLAEATGITIVLDGRVTDKAKVTVTTTLNNVPLDTAVRLLADMGDLAVVQTDNTLYVTSKENAKALQADKEKRRPPAFPPPGLVPPAR